ncbi:alpha/beta hydrolase [Thioclava sp. FR2]|uniref:alpha/beta hydrolase n=1 Tax=Thioclava sp. FR2 TaxID=3445780 RepID=UPI003EB71CB9
MKPISVFLLTLALAACAPRGAILVVPEAAKTGELMTVFIGTTRGRSEAGDFDKSRAETLSFARYDISIPPEREPGEIAWPPAHGKPNPKTHFLTAARTDFRDEPHFRADLATSLAHTGGEAIVFVHGFNNTFAEGTYRIAQMAHDLEIPGTIVHYSWSSAAEPLGYAHDRDSALFARDGLEGLLREVEAAGAKRMIVVAHSMGSALTMETLRQVAIRGDKDVMERIRGVVLISPDIDIDVFRAQAHAIPKLPQPFVVFTSERDRILRLSARLSGQTDRLGTLTDVTRVADLPITFLDVAAFNRGSGHFNVGNSPALLRLLERIASVDQALIADRAAQTGLLPGVVLTVQNATQIILRPVAEIGTAR